jgi:8-oxo-dGTP diphosphatase
MKMIFKKLIQRLMETPQERHIRVDHKHIRVGTAVAIFNEHGEILLGKRGKSHGSGCWSFAGGHVEKWETWEECAKREVLEETNLDIENIEYVTTKESMFKADGKHYNTIFLRATVKDGQQFKIMEKGKFDPIGWFDINAMPENLFGKLPEILEQLKGEVK